MRSERCNEIYRTILFAFNMKTFTFCYCAADKLLLEINIEKKSVRHVKLVQQSHLGNAQRSLLQTKLFEPNLLILSASSFQHREVNGSTVLHY